MCCSFCCWSSLALASSCLLRQPSNSMLPRTSYYPLPTATTAIISPILPTFNLPVPLPISRSFFSLFLNTHTHSLTHKHTLRLRWQSLLSSLKDSNIDTNASSFEHHTHSFIVSLREELHRTVPDLDLSIVAKRTYIRTPITIAQTLLQENNS